MNKNQKIALGCGSAGCLGLIVVGIAGGLVWFMSARSLSSSTNRGYNSNTNSGPSRNANANTDSDENANAKSATPDSSASVDDKHKLYHAATASGDSDIMIRVQRKLGLISANGVPNSEFAEFAKEHFAWALRNTDFVQEMSTPEKARAYVEEHIDD